MLLQRSRRESIRDKSGMRKLILASQLCCVISFAYSQERVVTVEYKKEIVNDSIFLYVKNLLPAPLTFEISCDTADFEAEILLSVDTVWQEVLGLKDFLKGDTASLGTYLKVGAYLGDKNAEHDGYEYSFPFAESRSYSLLQGFKGKFSHSTDQSRYAVDFTMDVGEPIHAARPGIVCYIIRRFDVGGRDRKKYIDKANKILILHSDGTIATYNHLKKDGVVVEIGERVEVGQLIGYSGNTGFTSKPHLHFVVRAGRVSVPIRFKDTRKLKVGRKYAR